jgi:hypothetical protein
MTRRSSRPKLIPDDAPLPPGWTRHHGGDCPLPPDSKPGLMFRGGGRFQPGVRRADAWGDMWRHDGSSMDIIAYRLASDGG